MNYMLLAFFISVDWNYFPKQQYIILHSLSDILILSLLYSVLPVIEGKQVNNISREASDCSVQALNFFLLVMNSGNLMVS